MLLPYKCMSRLQECRNMGMLPAGTAQFCDTRFSDMLYCSVES